MARDIEAGFVEFKINQQVISEEGSYQFQSQLNNSDVSTQDSSFKLDFTGPEVGTTFIDSSSDSGFSSIDNITSNVRPVVKFIAESNLSTLDNDGKYPFIFIDESKGDGTAPFDLSPFDTNLFTVSEEKLSQITVTLDSDLGPNIPTLVVSGISQSGSATVISGTSVSGDGSSGFTITSLGDVSSYESLEVSVSDGDSNTPDPKTTISILPEITGTFSTSNSSISLSVDSSLASTEASNLIVWY